MPKTKLQKSAFSFVMSLAMVIGMEHYNLAIINGGFQMWMFRAAWHWTDIPMMTCIVFVMEHFIAGPIAMRRAMRLVAPGKENPLLVTLTIAGCTVQLMCPIMSFWAALLFKYKGTGTFLSVYLQTLVCNFPMALLWQVFFAGPGVRLLFRKLYKTKDLAEPACAK